MGQETSRACTSSAGPQPSASATGGSAPASAYSHPDNASDTSSILDMIGLGGSAEPPAPPRGEPAELERSWSNLRHSYGSGQGSLVVSMRRRLPKDLPDSVFREDQVPDSIVGDSDPYTHTPKLYRAPIDIHLPLQQAVQIDQEEDLRLAHPPSTETLSMNVQVFDPRLHLSSSYGVLLSCLHPGEFKDATRDTFFGMVCTNVGEDISGGVPSYSKEYKAATTHPNEQKTSLLRVGYQHPKRFDSLWLMNIPTGFTQDRVLEVFFTLRRYSKELAFFAGSHLIMPMFADSTQAQVEIRDVARQYVAWFYHCFQEENPATMTIVTTDSDHAQVIVDAFHGDDSGLINALATEQNAALNADANSGKDGIAPKDIVLLKRPFATSLFERIIDWHTNTKDFVGDNDGKMGDNESIDLPPDQDPMSTSRLYLMKLLLYHVGILIKAWQNADNDARLVRLICATGQSIAESFLNQIESMKGYQDIPTLHQRCEFINQVLTTTAAENLMPSDFEAVRKLIAYGFIIAHKDYSPLVNAVDALYALSAIVYMLDTFLVDDDDEADEDDDGDDDDDDGDDDDDDDDDDDEHDDDDKAAGDSKQNSDDNDGADEPVANNDSEESPAPLANSQSRVNFADDQPAVDVASVSSASDSD
jgi:hypothetical protein